MPKKLEEIKNALLRDPDFKPRKKGQTKEEAAWAVANYQYKHLIRKGKK